MEALPNGTIVDGYRIERILGTGGFGITYFAVEVESGRKVALKEYVPSGLSARDPDRVTLRANAAGADEFANGLESFRREARALIQIRHPGVVAGFRLASANGTAYLAMDYLEGSTLASVLSQAGTLSQEEMQQLLPPLLDGLAAVHAAGQLHADIKPSNIFIRSYGGPVLIDFGAARFEFGRAGQQLQSIVSPGYAPFEQFTASGKLSPATDIYALGATLYRCVTGARPAEAPDRVAQGAYNLLVPAAVAGKGRYAASLLAAIDAALKLEAEQRPQSVDEFRALAFARASIAEPSAHDRPAHLVFISYAGANKATAELVCGALEQAGIRCWIAPRDTDAGNYGRSIIEGIRAARMLVLVLSPESAASPNVISEVAEAFDRKLALVPFRIAEFEVPDDLRFFIRTQHWIDAFPKAVESYLPRLIERVEARLAQAGALRKMKGRSRGAAPPTPRPGDSAAASAPAKPGPAGPPTGLAPGRRRTLVLAGGAAALALAVGLGMFFTMGPGGASGTSSQSGPTQGQTPPQKTAETAPKGAFRDCADCPEMLAVPAGSFTMGSPDAEKDREANEGPQRKVTFARPFAIGKHPITNRDYDACVAARACTARPDRAPAATLPTVYVSWEDAKSYVAWLAKKSGKPYRLPSEAEWEYAARAGTTTRYYWGDEIGRRRAACAGCGTPWDGKSPPPVGSFASNPWGLHDLHGSVWQWVEDCWQESYRDAPADGRAWVTGDCKRRNLRGGAFFSYPKSLRAAYRYAYEPKGRLGNIGFRIARDFD